MSNTLTSHDAAEVETAIHAFTGLITELQASHRALESRAQRMEAELCAANDQLASKVRQLDVMRRHQEAILLALPTGVVEREPNGRVRRINAAARELLGLDQGDPLESLSLAVDQPEGLLPIVDAKGVQRTLDLRKAVVRSEDGSATTQLQILEDRTEIERVTEHLHSQARMAALGTMAGGIAHEVRNPMNAIRGFAALLQRSHGTDATVDRHTQRIIAGVDEVDAILSSVLAFADPEKLSLERLDAATCLQDAIQLVQRDNRELADWKLIAEPAEASFVGDGFQLRIALRNLIANAIDAQPHGGTVHMSVGCNEVDLFFQVDDAGQGLDSSILQRLRDPFFTTRPEGTGLGLALVDTIARLHGGSLEIDPTRSPLGGARFTLRVPLLPRRTAQ